MLKAPWVSCGGARGRTCCLAGSVLFTVLGCSLSVARVGYKPAVGI